MKRLTRGDTPKSIAAKIGVDPSQVSRWRSGKSEPSAENASRLAEAYGGDRFEALAAAGHVDPAQMQQPAFEQPELPALPRDATNAPTLGHLDIALGVHPFRPDTFIPMSSHERKVLVSARNKLFHDRSDLTDEERVVLTRFIEDDELRTLHARIDWLPRAEQLEVSAHVNELQLNVEERWSSDGYTNESEQLPDYARPNPLPRLGAFPDPDQFPPQTPVFATKEKKDDLEAETQPHAQAEGNEGQEAGAGNADDEMVRSIRPAHWDEKPLPPATAKAASKGYKQSDDERDDTE